VHPGGRVCNIGPGPTLAIEKSGRELALVFQGGRFGHIQKKEERRRRYGENRCEKEALVAAHSARHVFMGRPGPCASYRGGSLNRPLPAGEPVQGHDRGIQEVFAVIKPPDYSTGTPDTPVTDLPTIDLISVGNSRYEGTYTNFTSSGTYNIAVFAMDRKGVLSLPVQTTVTVTTASSCLAVSGDLSIKVPCAEYNGTRYGFLLDFYRNPDDLSGYYWKLVMATLTAGEGADCIPIATDLSMPIPCVAYNSTQYGFTLKFYSNPYDPSGLYWKMDMSTLEVK